jgi:hypothetical protein
MVSSEASSSDLIFYTAALTCDSHHPLVSLSTHHICEGAIVACAALHSSTAPLLLCASVLTAYTVGQLVLSGAYFTTGQVDY